MLESHLRGESKGFHQWREDNHKRDCPMEVATLVGNKRMLLLSFVFVLSPIVLAGCAGGGTNAAEEAPASANSVDVGGIRGADGRDGADGVSVRGGNGENGEEGGAGGNAIGGNAIGGNAIGGDGGNGGNGGNAFGGNGGNGGDGGAGGSAVVGDG
jgi:hypothetical protein